MAEVSNKHGRCSSHVERRSETSLDAQSTDKKDCLTGVPLTNLSPPDPSKFRGRTSDTRQTLNKLNDEWALRISEHIEKDAISLGEAFKLAAKRNSVIVIGSHESRAFAPFHETLITYLKDLKKEGITSIALPFHMPEQDGKTKFISDPDKLEAMIENSKGWYRERFEGLDNFAREAVRQGFKLYPVAEEPVSLAIKGTQRVGNTLWEFIGAFTPIQFRLPPVYDIKIDPVLVQSSIKTTLAEKGKLLAILSEDFSLRNKPTIDSNDPKKKMVPGLDSIDELAVKKGVVRFRVVHSYSPFSGKQDYFEHRWTEFQDTLKKKNGNIVLPDNQLSLPPEKKASDYVIFLPKYSNWWSK